MDKRDGLGLKVETVGLVTIQFIAQDGTPETVGVGTVHPELVGTAGMRPEGDQSEE